ncbi:MAG: hypothetical protein K2M53_10520 [Muribaculaceae bacterium]|nr:hypothetical protein [Muribaculaceae bacterium]
MTPTGKIIMKWSILLVLFVYCIAISVWAKSEADRHICEGIDIEVKGNRAMHDVVAKGVARELARYPKRLKGAKLSQINTLELEKYLENLNTFESVNCMITSGGRLTIEIEPLVPVMRLFIGNHSYYVNKNGKQIESKAEFYTEAPVVTGNFNSKFQPEDVLPVVKYISKDPMLRELVGMVEAKSPNNILLVPRMLGHVVNFGDTTRLDEKKDALQLFYKKVMPYKGWEEYDTISVKFRDQVVATRRIKPVAKPQIDDTEDLDPDEATLVDHINATEEDVANTEE